MEMKEMRLSEEQKGQKTRRLLCDKRGTLKNVEHEVREKQAKINEMDE